METVERPDAAPLFGLPRGMWALPARMILPTLYVNIEKLIERGQGTGYVMRHAAAHEALSVTWTGSGI